MTSKRRRSGRRTTYYVSYRYAVADQLTGDRSPYRDTTNGGEEIVAEMTTGRKEWEQATEGQQVTVLYWPRKPRRSVVFEFGGYRLASPCVSAG